MDDVNKHEAKYTREDLEKAIVSKFKVVKLPTGEKGLCDNLIYAHVRKLEDVNKKLIKRYEDMKPKRSITKGQVDAIKLLLERGATYKYIQDTVGVSSGTVWRVKKGYYDKIE